MSYYIEDDHKVIKTSRGFIFMTLGGDNNVTTSKWVGGNRGWIEVRARSWCGPCEEILDQPEQVILDYCHRVYGDSPEYQSFKKNGKWVYHKEMEQYFRSGMRRAQPLEDIIRANPGQALIATVMTYDDDHPFGEKHTEQWLYNTVDLENWIDEAKAFSHDNKASYKDVSIYLSFCGENRLVYAPANKETQTVVKNKHGGYVNSYIAGKELQFSSNLDDALVFSSEKDARSSLGVVWKELRYVSLASQQKAAEKNYVLLFGEGKLSNMILTKCSKKSIYGSFDLKSARRFASKAEAVCYVNRLREKRFDESLTGKFSLMNVTDRSCEELAV